MPKGCDLKTYKISIKNSQNKLLNLLVTQPETISETYYLLQTKSENTDGFIHLPLPGEVCIQPYVFQYANRLEFDWIGIDWHGKIISIDKNVSPENRIKLHPNSTTVLSLTPGLCDYQNITIENIIYK